MNAFDQILLPKSFQTQDKATISSWHQCETEQLESSTSKAYLLFGCILPLFIGLDISHHHTSNPSLIYAFIQRAIPAAFFLIYGCLLLQKWRPYGLKSGLIHKLSGLVVFFAIICSQFYYRNNFPDRIGFYPPLIMALGVYIFRLPPKPTCIWAVSEVLTWIIFSWGDLNIIKVEANFQLFGIILAIAFSHNALGRIEIFLTQRQRESALKERNEFLAEKEHLLKVVCHDIGNPLGVVTGSILLMEMKQNKIGEEAEETWGRLKKSVLQIGEILNGVREIAAASSQKINLHLEPTKLRNVVEICIENLQEKISSKGLEIIITDHLKPETLVSADPNKLAHHIITNLLTNAIKFSYKFSKIEFILSETDDEIHMLISDSGAGIPLALQKAIFDPHTHTNRKGTEGENGTGFGLPIVKLYVEKHYGKIEVNSRSQCEFPANHGTTFSVCLPRAA